MSDCLLTHVTSSLISWAFVKHKKALKISWERQFITYREIKAKIKANKLVKLWHLETLGYNKNPTKTLEDQISHRWRHSYLKKERSWSKTWKVDFSTKKKWINSKMFFIENQGKRENIISRSLIERNRNWVTRSKGRG